ncbi:MAG: DUF5908 family protein [Bacteroidota bacterium]
MPIEIKELIIRATVDSGSPNTAANSSQNASSNSGANKPLKDAVDELMKMMKEKNER